MNIPPGKLPPGLLNRLLKKYALPAPGVVVGPGIGLDAAVVDAGIPGEYLILKTDPITLVGEDLGFYAVNINANDIACMGGTPRWFTAAVILPEGRADEALVESIFRSLSETCASIGVSLTGGHTEITHGIDRPIIVGNLTGTVPRDGLKTAAGVQPGDSIILTKGIAIEAVSIIAREKRAELLQAYPREFVERCAGFIHEPGISVVKDARIAIGAGDVHALHDPTEGGLSSGLYEMAEAAGVRLVIDAERIPVLPEAAELLGRYRLDALGTIASGALLIAAPEGEAEKIVQALQAEGIPASRIGSASKGEKGVALLKGGASLDFPKLERDEITKIFSLL